MENDDGNLPVGDSRSDSTVDTLNGIPIIDPAELGGGGRDDSGNAAPAPKRGRGRPAGSGGGRKPAQKEVQTSVAGIEKLLFSLHNLASAGLDIEELKLVPEEAKALAESIGNVAQHYAYEANPKVMAWAGLMGVLGAIYGPRIWAIKNRKGKKNAPQTPADNVTPIGNFDPAQFGVR